MLNWDNIMKSLELKIKSSFIGRIYRKTKFWIACRTYNKFHVVNLGLKPGWLDSREMLLYANFAVLSHFVEKELSQLELTFRKYNPTARGSHRGVSNRELGLSYLSCWEGLLPEMVGGKDVNALTREFAKTVRELYVWWNDIRPARKNQYENELHELYDSAKREGREYIRFVPLSDDSNLCRVVSDLTPHECDKRDELCKNSFNLESSWDQEDQNMLHRLIDIRLQLWS